MDLTNSREEGSESKQDFRKLSDLLLENGLVAPDLDQEIFANLSEDAYEDIIILISTRTWF